MLGVFTFLCKQVAILGGKGQVSLAAFAVLQHWERLECLCLPAARGNLRQGLGLKCGI